MTKTASTLTVFVVAVGLALPAAAQWATSGSNIYNTNSGNIGIGTTSPITKVTMAAATPAGGGLNFGEIMRVITTGGPTAWASFHFTDNATADAFMGFTCGSSQTTKMFGVAIDSGTPLFVVNGLGNVGIGTTSPAQKLDVNGNINVSGNVNAKYQDFAEWVPADGPLDPGTVVVLNPQKNNMVIASASRYDTSVAGVVTAQPGIILGDPSQSKEKIATSGRVRVHVDATNAPIRIGDLLVTSDQPGMAMRSEPVDVGGVKIHRPGTIIGKALEPLPSGRGDILVLLTMQ